MEAVLQADCALFGVRRSGYYSDGAEYTARFVHGWSGVPIGVHDAVEDHNIVVGCCPKIVAVAETPVAVWIQPMVLELPDVPALQARVFSKMSQ